MLFQGLPWNNGMWLTYSLPAYFTSFPSFRPGSRTHWPCLVLTLAESASLGRRIFFNRGHKFIKPDSTHCGMPVHRALKDSTIYPNEDPLQPNKYITSCVFFFKWYTTSKYIHDFFFKKWYTTRMFCWNCIMWATLGSVKSDYLPVLKYRTSPEMCIFRLLKI